MARYGLNAEGAPPCAGHPCDECATCQRGRCCRGDDPDYRLPTPGDWSDPIHGEIGVLREDGARLECHICGGWYQALGIHAWRAHNITGDEYRALFGLRRGHGLSGADLKAQQQARAQTTNKSGLRPLTEEQRAKGQENARRPRPEGTQQARERLATTRQRHADRRVTDPDYDRVRYRKISVARGGDPLAEARCPVCEQSFYPGPPSHRRQTCGAAACVNQWKTRRVALPPDLYKALADRAKVTGQSVEELACAGLRMWLDTTDKEQTNGENHVLRPGGWDRQPAGD